MKKGRLAVAALAFAAPNMAWAQASAPAGGLKGTALVHSAASLEGVVREASIGLPASVTGAAPFLGAFRDAPAGTGRRVPVVLFLHGSSGLGLQAIADWQGWLAGLGIASFAPNSFALPNRVTYTSPIDKASYEKIHTLRASEIAPSLDALRSTPWADPKRMVLAGASEGGPAVARYTGTDFAGRILYSWSCENNYFVDQHRTVVRSDEPVLNIMSSTDVYFSPSNEWLGNPTAKGHCGDALKADKQATIVLIPGAPHTLLNLPAARHATEGFLRDVFGP